MNEHINKYIQCSVFPCEATGFIVRFVENIRRLHMTRLPAYLSNLLLVVDNQ